jgi:hypothetical protein
MPRDYSSRPNSRARSSGKRKPRKRTSPAARPTQRKKTKPRKKPSGGRTKRGAGTATPRISKSSFIWLLCLVFLCVVAGAITYIATRPTGHGPQGTQLHLPGEQESADDQPTQSESDSDETQQHSQDDQPEKQYSFYDILPQQQIKIETGQPAHKPVVDNSSPHEVEPTAETPAPEADQPTAQPESGGYIIQAGAFSSHGDADHRKARLTLLGITAEIVDVRTQAGKTVYRVQSDRIDSRQQAEKLSQRLSSNGIDTLLRQAE